MVAHFGGGRLGDLEQLTLNDLVRVERPAAL